MKNEKTRKLVISALFASLACIMTMILPIPSPMDGYLNLGDGFVLLGAFVMGPTYGAVSAGIGSMLADLFLGYPLYAPGTLVIKGLTAFVAGVIYKKSKKGNMSALLSGVCGEIVMVLGYFIYAAMIFGKGLAAFASVPGNLMQAVLGIVVSAILVEIYKRVNKNK